MKKISKSLENKIIRCANHYKIANELNEEIREWLWKNNLNLNDSLIDACQIECNPYEFIDFLNGISSKWGDTVDDFIIEENERVDLEDFM